MESPGNDVRNDTNGSITVRWRRAKVKLPDLTHILGTHPLLFSQDGSKHSDGRPLEHMVHATGNGHVHCFDLSAGHSFLIVF